jgi:hypothetical protein
MTDKAMREKVEIPELANKEPELSQTQKQFAI